MESRRPLPAARLLIFAAVAVGAFILALGPISDGDIYWHLAAGREMLRRHAVLRTDPFTLSAAGRPWVDVHWLFQIGAYLIHRASGFVGLAVAKAALVAGGGLIATRAAERSGGAVGRAWCAIALLGGLFLARHLMPIRPVIVTMVFLAVFLSVLESMRLGARRSLFVLPLCQVVWSNCQGLFLLGPALIASYLIGAWLSRASRCRPWPFEPESPASIRPLALTLALCLLASFVTPYGLAAAALPARLFSRLVPGTGNVFSATVAENVPPFVLERTAPEQIGHFKWVLAGLAVAFAIVRPRLHLAHLLLLVAFAGLALMANRNVLLFYWMAAPLAAIAITPVGAKRIEGILVAWPHWPPPVSHRRAAIALATVLGAELALAGFTQAREQPVGAPTPFHFPVESARVLARLRATGPIFAPDQHGGYLTFTLPAVRPYIDTRLVLHTSTEYADYLALFADPTRFDALAAEQKFNAIVLTTTYPDQYLGLIRHLAAAPAWRLIFTDGYEVLFTREGTPLALDSRSTVDAILNQLAARFGGGHAALHAAARLNLARLLVVLGQSRQAEYVLSSLDSRAAAQLRARAHFAAGELAAAESLARILVRESPRDVRSLTLLAEIAVAKGETGRAWEWLRRALAIDPYDLEARSVVERIEGSIPGR